MVPNPLAPLIHADPGTQPPRCRRLSSHRSPPATNVPGKAQPPNGPIRRHQSDMAKLADKGWTTLRQGLGATFTAVNRRFTQTNALSRQSLESAP